MIAAIPADVRPALTVEDFSREYLENLRYGQGVDISFASKNDLYMALATTVRAYLIQAWLDTLHAHRQLHSKFVFYLSAEYLTGRQLDNNLLNTGLTDIARQSLAGLGLSLDELREYEVEPGLGNGGLGRLAACFLDSLATLRMPAVGYGLRYEFGIFRQTFADGWQMERPDDWLHLGNPWEFSHPEHAVKVGFGGRTEAYATPQGETRFRWKPAYSVLGVPYNTMVPGYRSGTVNTLRLWSSRATHEFDLQIFNEGDYTRAVQSKIASENISKVLYPDDTTPQGRALRLEQQYFFVACSLADMLRYLAVPVEQLPGRIAVQLNDTHPSIAIAELMRLLVDERHMPWPAAWDITRSVFSYTNHTLLPEALEKWPVRLLEQMLPRHLEIIYEINRRFLDEVRSRFPGDIGRLQRMSLIEEWPERQVRMAHLAAVGSYKINGVAPIQSRLLRETVLQDFAEMWPDKFTNVTNGVTPRRFLRLANPLLAALITSRIGEGWLNDLEQLRQLEPYADDPDFRAEWRRVKRDNKAALAAVIQDRAGLAVNPDAAFDVMVKRLHEYKRQLLKILHVITLYNRLTANPQATPPMTPRVVIFGAKAAPGYHMAKLIIRLINAVAATINHDPAAGDRLKVVYLANYNVTLAERIIPAADISEQISLAGKEASGTSNMKLALNGAVTAGTLDGANIDLREQVGAENFFLFGLAEEQVRATRLAGYHPATCYAGNPELRQAIDQIDAGRFLPGQPSLFQPIVNSLLHQDEYMLLADYASYISIQDRIDSAFRDADRWTRMSILNCARSGYFSSDRSIREYCNRIWGVTPIGVNA